MITKFMQGNSDNDLFENTRESERKIRKKVKILLPPIKDSIVVTYENIIFILIFFIMSAIIFFSLGVEKGRKEIASIKNVAEASSIEGILEKKKIKEASVTVERSLWREKTRVPLPADKESPVKTAESLAKAAYALRLASYNEEPSALKEKERLAKAGYAASIRKAGKYYQLYIDAADKTEAFRLQKELTDKYKDCYVTKL